MSDTSPSPESIAAAEAEVAAAEEHLAAAVAAETPAPPSPPPAAANPDQLVHIAAAQPWNEFHPGDDLPVVTFDGTDVTANVAETIRERAAAARFPLR